jgi:competence protein ComEC
LGRTDGVLVVDSVLGEHGRPAMIVRVRGRLMDVVDELYGSRAPVVHALIFNRKDGLDRDLRESFARAGMIHLLAISGFHVGVVMLWATVLLRLIRVGRQRAIAGAVLVVLSYVALLGWPPAATRAVILAALYAVCRVRQRYVPSSALVATTCLVMFAADPWVVAKPGAWLSVAAFCGVLVLDAWAVRVFGGGWLVRTFAGSLGATLTTAPLTAMLFGVVSLVGLVINLVAMPLTALALPAVFASVLVAPIVPALGAALAASGGVLLGLLRALAGAGAAVPGGAIDQVPGVSAGLPWVALLGAGVWLLGRRNTLEETGRRALWVCLLVLWGTLIPSLWSPRSAGGSDLALHFLDVRQGDGALVRTPGGNWVAIDGGPRSDRWDAGREVVVPFLRRHGARRLAVMVLSHADADHLGGVPSILESLPASLVLDPAAAPASALYLAFLDELLGASVRWRPGRRGDHFELDGVTFTVIHPDTGWSGWGHSVNEDSIALLVEYGDFSALLTGDIGYPVEHQLAGSIGPVDVLKVGHHGSNGSTGDDWLRETRPSVAVISVGQNRYGHPAPEVLDRLRRRQVSVWRTDREGTVTVVTDGDTFRVKGRGRSEQRAARLGGSHEEGS